LFNVIIFYFDFNKSSKSWIWLTPLIFIVYIQN